MNKKLNLFCFCFLMFLEVHCYEFAAYINSKYVKCVHDRQLPYKTNAVEVYVYDFSSEESFRAFSIDTAARHIITSDHKFMLDHKIIVFVPDHRNHLKSGKFIQTEELMIQTFRNVRNTTLIVIDHSAYTHVKGVKMRNYELAVLYTYYIGVAIGKFLGELHTRGIKSKHIHGVGHGLGAQMLGHAGATYQEMTGVKIHRITGIDPEGPCFYNARENDQLRKGNADFVDIHHCNAGFLGSKSVLGDVDFFFNYDGRDQPGCYQKSKSQRDKCSHMICLQQWVETVENNNKYLAWKCENYNLFRKGMCNMNEVTIAGYCNPGNVFGSFYAMTESEGIIRNE